MAGSHQPFLPILLSRFSDSKVHFKIPKVVLHTQACRDAVGEIPPPLMWSLCRDVSSAQANVQKEEDEYRRAKEKAEKEMREYQDSKKILDKEKADLERAQRALEKEKMEYQKALENLDRGMKFWNPPVLLVIPLKAP